MLKIHQDFIMTASGYQSFANELFVQYDRFLTGDFPVRHFGPDLYHGVIDRIIASSKGLLNIQSVGVSFENRPIRLISLGKGSTKVFLWSQMHGDESTATMAIADMLNYLVATRDTQPTRRLLSQLTLLFLPMLNPDGAARTQRRTAQNIDMNRDALALVTPEARLLKQLQHELKPEFGFNLHDQELSTVGTSNNFTAIALLAPAFDKEKSDNAVRTNAKKVANVFAATLSAFAPERLARYDDTFEPRAFGDNMQKWGTSTVLVESGHEKNDPQKNFIRKLNFTGILTSCYAMASGEYRSSNIECYEQLPFNGKKAYDVIVRNIVIDHHNENLTSADIAISYQVDTHSDETPKLIDIGDLSTFIGMKELDGKAKKIPTERLILGQAFEWENLF